MQVFGVGGGDKNLSDRVEGHTDLDALLEDILFGFGSVPFAFGAFDVELEEGLTDFLRRPLGCIKSTLPPFTE